MCGQRRSDLVLFGRKHRRADGLQIKIGKLRDKDHFIPLRAAELAEIDSWSCSDPAPWITSAFGKPMNGDALWHTLDRFFDRCDGIGRAEIEPARVARDGGSPLARGGQKAFVVVKKTVLELEKFKFRCHTLHKASVELVGRMPCPLASGICYRHENRS